MSIKVRVAGVTKDFVSGKVQVGGVLKDLVQGYVQVGGVLKEVFNFSAPAPPPAPNPAPPPPAPVPGVVLAVNVSPTTVSGTRNLAGVCQTSADAVVTVSNGVAPYVYSWAIVSWTATGGGTPTADTPTANATRFSQNLPNAGDSTTAVFRCTVQDANTNTGYVDVNVGLYATTNDTGTYTPPGRPGNPGGDLHEY